MCVSWHNSNRIKKLCLSPLTKVHIFSKIRSHGGPPEGGGTLPLYKAEEVLYYSYRIWAYHNHKPSFLTPLKHYLKRKHRSDLLANIGPTVANYLQQLLDGFP